MTSRRPPPGNAAPTLATWRVEDAWRRALLGSVGDRRDLGVMAACAALGAALVAASSGGAMVGICVWAGVVSTAALLAAAASWRTRHRVHGEAMRGIEALEEHLRIGGPPAS